MSHCGRGVGHGQGTSMYLIYDAFVECDHKLASIWTMVWDVSLKTIFASATTIFELGTIITLFVLQCMLNYLWTYVTCGLYVECCTILVVCWIIQDASWYLTDYRVYIGSSLIVQSLRWLPLYLCPYKLVGSAIVLIQTTWMNTQERWCVII